MALLELSIPPKFFESANSENDYESVSERIAKAFLSDILNVKNILRGIPELKEPDYMSNEKGYEVTFAVNSELIPQLKGIKDLNGEKHNIEQSLINDIKSAVERKASKNYTCAPNLVIITIATLPTWYYPIFADDSDPFSKIVWKTGTYKRNNLFSELYKTYIKTYKLENIYIIQPTFLGSFALYNIKNFIETNGDGLTHVQTSKPKAFPTYKVVAPERMEDIANFNIRIINYTIAT